MNCTGSAGGPNVTTFGPPAKPLQSVVNSAFEAFRFNQEVAGWTLKFPKGLHIFADNNLMWVQLVHDFTHIFALQGLF